VRVSGLYAWITIDCSRHQSRTVPLQPNGLHSIWFTTGTSAQAAISRSISGIE